MTTTLFVKANNRPSAYSVSVKLYEAFMKSYMESHPRRHRYRAGFIQRTSTLFGFQYD